MLGAPKLNSLQTKFSSHKHRSLGSCCIVTVAPFVKKCIFLWRVFHNCASFYFMVIISVLTLGWMMEETEHLRHFVYLCKANGLVVRLVCVGKCGDGLEADLFTCGGCGGQTAQGVDDRTAPRSVSCGGGGAVWALRRFGERRSSRLSLTHAHTTCGAGLGVDCVNLRMIHMSIKVYALRSRSLLMLLMLIFPWCPCELTTSQKSIDTSHLLSKATVRMRPLSCGSLHVNDQVLLQSHANDRLLIYFMPALQC